MPDKNTRAMLKSLKEKTAVWPRTPNPPLAESAKMFTDRDTDKTKKCRIAFVTKNWIGDILLQTPAIRVLRENFPDAEIIGFVPRRCHEVLINNPDVDYLVPFHEREDTRGFWNTLRFVAETRKKHIERVYFFHRSFSRVLIFAASGVGARTGYATKRRGVLLTQAVGEPARAMHQAEYALGLLRSSGLAPLKETVSTRFYPSESDRDIAGNLLSHMKVNTKNYVILHGGANWAPKRWSPEYFAVLADYINEHYDAEILLTGGSGDFELAKDIYRQTRIAQPMILAGRTTLGGLGALFEGARLVVSGDTGPMHIAAGVGAPLVALFLATDSGYTGPKGNGPMVVVQKTDALRSNERGPEECRAKIFRVPEIDPETVISIIEESGLLGENNSEK